MRLTSLLRSGLNFENLYLKPKGIIVFTTSPFEQNVIKGQLVNRIPNLARRINDKLFVVVPFVAGYWLYDWMVNENLRLKRKNPADYENDE